MILEQIKKSDAEFLNPDSLKYVRMGETGLIINCYPEEVIKFIHSRDIKLLEAVVELIDPNIIKAQSPEEYADKVIKEYKSLSQTIKELRK